MRTVTTKAMVCSGAVCVVAGLAVAHWADNARAGYQEARYISANFTPRIETGNLEVEPTSGSVPLTVSIVGPEAFLEYTKYRRIRTEMNCVIGEASRRGGFGILIDLGGWKYIKDAYRDRELFCAYTAHLFKGGNVPN